MHPTILHSSYNDQQHTHHGPKRNTCAIPPLRARSTGQVTHQECILLNRVLSDKAKLPPVCVPPRKETAHEASSQQRRRRQQQQLRASTPPEDESAVGGLVRRITGAVQPVLSSLSPLHAPKQGARQQ